MVDLNVNVNCEDIKNYNYENHSTLGEMYPVQNKCGGELSNAVTITIIH